MVAKDRHFLELLPADWPRLSRLIAFLLGVAATSLFAPMAWAYVAPLLLLPLLFVSLHVSPRDSAAHFFWFGFGLFLTGTYWIYISVHVFGNAPLWIALLLMVGLSLIMAALISVAGWLLGQLSHGEPMRLLLIAPASWVLIEWLRGWILTGFPWMSLGYGQIDTLLAAWAPVLGVYGVSFMLVLSAAALLAAFRARGIELVACLVSVLLPWVIAAILSAVDWTEEYGEAVAVTLVQGGVDQDKKWLADQRQPTLNYYLRATQAAPKSDIVVWPEVAIPAVQDQVPAYLDTVEEEARATDKTVLFGILEREYSRSEQGQVFNSVLALGAQQRQSYRKRHLVPFGEYFPVPPSVREWMRLRNLPYADIAKGDAEQPLIETADGTRIAVAICYEDAYGAEQLYALPDADLLVNVSNDAWFGDSIAPHQHLQIARMRSLEVGRETLRATNTGISAVIRADGSVAQTAQQFQPAVINDKVRKRRGTTPYANAGNWPIIGISLLILGFYWVRSRVGL